LRKHCDKIKRVCGLFKNVDTDDDGIINHDQLFVLLEKLEVKHDIELEELMQLLDPFQTNSITFSHLLHYLQEIPNFKEAFLPN
jgi:Ca2+-binding EF-hand superfamily protein